MTGEAGLTPAMRQYRAAKDAHPDALLFFRMGDFYELFYEDAIVASRELQLTLTARDKAKSVPMCGVPYHAAGGYLQRLLRKGFKVAMCDQMEDPKTAKTVVRREVTRVLTPGTALDAALGAGESQWLASVASVGSGAGACVGVASIDLSTGEFRATEFGGAHAWALACDELARMIPAEMLLARGAAFGGVASRRQPTLAGEDGAPGFLEDENAGQDIGGARTELDEWVFTDDYAVPLLRQQLKVHSLDGMGLGGHAAAAVAAGAIVHYLRATKQGALEHLDGLRFYEKRDSLELDAVSVRNLELVEPLFSSEGPQTTLLWTMDACSTPDGQAAAACATVAADAVAGSDQRAPGCSGSGRWRSAPARRCAACAGWCARPGKTAGARRAGDGGAARGRVARCDDRQVAGRARGGEGVRARWRRDGRNWRERLIR